MTNSSVKFTVEEFEAMYHGNLEQSFGYVDKLYGEWFDQVDLDENGIVSLDEWIKHSQALSEWLYYIVVRTTI